MDVPMDALKQVFASVVKNARVRGLPVEITLQDVAEMWRAGNGRCAVSGIPFDFQRIAASKRRPFAASVDRIDCGVGYTKANSRLVCVAVNYAMSDWGFEVLKLIAHGITKTPSRRPVTRPENANRLRGTYVRRVNGRTTYEVLLTDASGRRRYLGSFATEEAAHAHWQAALTAVVEGRGIDAYLPRRPSISHQAGVEATVDTPVRTATA